MKRRAVPDWLTQWEYAHRGLHGSGVPENSLQAARLAIKAGMGIECDIQRSADDWPMVFHDWELDRLTDAGGQTQARTMDDLRAISYRESDQQIAKLADLLALVAGRAPLLIEMKSKTGYDIEKSCEAVASALATYSGNYAVMSFDPRVARWFRKHSPQTCVGLVMREDEHGYTQSAWQRRMAYWIALPDFIAYHVEALPNRWVERMRRRGLPVLTWTVNSPSTRTIALARADALISEGAGLA